jgi:hypothetical protein
MDIEITEFLKSECPRDYSASVAEIGDGAGAVTWSAAMENSDPIRFMTTPERINAFRAFVLDSGGWDESECNAFSVRALESLFIQWVSGDLREMFFDSFRNKVDFANMTEAQWQQAESMGESGIVPTRIFRGTDGRVYFYCGT